MFNINDKVLFSDLDNGSHEWQMSVVVTIVEKAVGSKLYTIELEDGDWTFGIPYVQLAHIRPKT